MSYDFAGEVPQAQGARASLASVQSDAGALAQRPSRGGSWVGALLGCRFQDPCRLTAVGVLDVTRTGGGATAVEKLPIHADVDPSGWQVTVELRSTNSGWKSDIREKGKRWVRPCDLISGR